MNRYLSLGLIVLAGIGMALSLAGCPPNRITLSPLNPPTSTPAASCTPVSYSDNFATNTLGNYSIMDGYWSPSSASAQYISVASGEFRVAPPSVVYNYSVVNDAVFSHSYGNYTVEGDFKLDTVAQGVFGLIFRSTPASAYGYIFQWNGLNNRWEIEKQKGPAIYDYVGSNTSNAYTLGTWVHLKVVASGSAFNAWETPESAPGVTNGVAVQLFTNTVDNFTAPAPYTSGGVGIRAYNVVGGNILHVTNFIAATCP